MSNLLWKKKNENKNKNVQDNRKKTERKNKEREDTWTLLNTAYEIKKKKERTDIFSKIDSTSLHRLKKKKKRKLNIFELWL